MLAFFRRILKNWWVGAILALVALAIVVTGVGTPGGGGGLFGGGGASAGGEAIAKMKGGVVSSEEALRRAQQMYQEARQQDPKLDLAGFVAQGGADAAARGLITSRAIEAWAARNGMRPSERQIDGEIASISAFNGPDGKFDRRTFLALLAQRRLSEADLRQGIAGDIIRRQLLSPVAGGVRTPQPIVDAFARTLLEKRTGSVALVPAAALPAGPAPGEAAVQAYYRRNVARYSLPERRVIRYAPLGLEQVAAAARPSDAEIAAWFRAHAADYAAREERSFSRIVFPAEAAAKAFVAKVRGGTSFADAARAAGFATADTALGKQTRAQVAALGTAPLADAAFALAQGAVTDPVKAPLGWFVLRADQVTKLPARTIEQARPEIALLLARQKGEAALSDLVAKAQSAIDGGATFDDAVKANGLAAAATPPLVSSGLAPADPAFRPAPVVQALLKPAFDATADDDATVETLGQDRFALLKVGQIVPAAPEPLAAVRAAVVRDLQLEAALVRIKAVAEAIAAKVNGGVPFAAALAGAGVRVEPPKPVTVRQYDLMQLEQQQRRPAPPAVAALFRLAPGKARALAAPGGAGWFVVHLDKAEPAPAVEIGPLAAASRREFDQALTTELAEQFAKALLKAAGVEENRAAIARLKARLTGGASAGE